MDTSVLCQKASELQGELDIILTELASRSDALLGKGESAEQKAITDCFDELVAWCQKWLGEDLQVQ